MVHLLQMPRKELYGPHEGLSARLLFEKKIVTTQYYTFQYWLQSQ